MALLPDRVEDWIGDDHPVRMVDLLARELDLQGFMQSALPKPVSSVIARQCCSSCSSMAT
jgi:hypothetical protein